MVSRKVNVKLMQCQELLNWCDKLDGEDQFTCAAPSQQNALHPQHWDLSYASFAQAGRIYLHCSYEI